MVTNPPVNGGVGMGELSCTVVWSTCGARPCIGNKVSTRICIFSYIKSNGSTCI